MKRNPYDSSGCLEQGKDAESKFVNLAQQRGLDIREATAHQNIVDHWDKAIRKDKGRWYRVEIKSMKKINRSDKESQARYTIIELKGVTGHPGWLYGKSDFFAFEMKNRFIIVAKDELVILIEEQLKLGIYDIRTRPGRQDKFFNFPSRFIDEIKTTEWLFN